MRALLFGCPKRDGIFDPTVNREAAQPETTQHGQLTHYARSAKRGSVKLEDARKQFERSFERAMKAVQSDSTTGARRSSKVASSRSRTAVRKPSTGSGRAAPVQTAIAKVLSKRRTGLTMERLQAALPDFDQKSLLNATFVMRRKGTVAFDRSGKGRGKYVWAENASAK
jgi:hypothetical protein